MISWPPCAAITSATTASPRPLPPASRERPSSRRTNRSVTRSRSSMGMPGPSSSTSMVTVGDGPDDTSTAIDTDDSACRAAFATTWSSARRAASASTWMSTVGGSSTISMPTRRRRPATSRTRSSTASDSLVCRRSSSRDSSSRSSTSCCRRSVSRSTRSATSSQSPVVSSASWRRATSSSARITAMGVRSSWAASLTRRRFESLDLLEPIEHRVHRGRQLGDLVVRRGCRHPFVQRLAVDRRDLRGDRVHGAECPAGDRPRERPDQQHHHRYRPPQHLSGGGDRVGHLGE